MEQMHFLPAKTEEEKVGSFFFTNDIHIIGLNLGHFETHLWWLLSYRRNLTVRKEISYKNKIYYYFPSFERDVQQEKLQLLESLDISLSEVECCYSNADRYPEFYENVYRLLSAVYSKSDH